MKKFHHLTLAALALAALLPQACGLVEIDEVKDINTEVTVAPGTEVTVMSEFSKTLGELLTDNQGGIITVTADGDYMISYQIVDKQNLGDGFSFDASKFALNLSDHFDYTYAFSDTTTIPARTPISCNAADKDAFSSLLKAIGVKIDLDFFESLLSQNYSFDFDVDFSVSDFPEMIKSFKKADLNGKLSMNLVPSGIPFQKFVFKQGFAICFPSFFRFSNCDNNLFEIKDGYKLVAKQDVDVVLGTGISFNLDLASLDLGDGVDLNGSLPLKDKVSVSGVISVNPEEDLIGEKETVNLTDKDYIAQQLEEYTTLIDPTASDYEYVRDIVVDQFIINTLHLTPGEPGHEVTIVKNDVAIGNLLVVCGYAANNVAIQNATIKLSNDAIPSFDAKDFSIDIQDKLPKELAGSDVNIELSDVQVTLDLDSTLPFGFDLNANLIASTGATVHHEYVLGPLTFDANAKTVWSLGTHANGEESGIKYKEVKDKDGHGLGSLLSPIPAKVEVKDFNVSFDETKWITAESGKTYGGVLSADIKAPLAFSPETNLSISLDMDDMEVNLDQVSGYLKYDTKAEVKFSYENEIPLNFAMTMVVKDADKKVMEGVAPKDAITIKAASKTGPSKNDVKIELTIPSGGKMIKSIGFTVTASGEDASLRLNPNQKISLKNVKFCLPDGVTTDLKDIIKK